MFTSTVVHWCVTNYAMSGPDIVRFMEHVETQGENGEMPDTPLECQAVIDEAVLFALDEYLDARSSDDGDLPHYAESAYWACRMVQRAPYEPTLRHALSKAVSRVHQDDVTRAWFEACFQRYIP